MALPPRREPAAPLPVDARPPTLDGRQRSYRSDLTLRIQVPLADGPPLSLANPLAQNVQDLRVGTPFDDAVAASLAVPLPSFLPVTSLCSSVSSAWKVSSVFKPPRVTTCGQGGAHSTRLSPTFCAHSQPPHPAWHFTALYSPPSSRGCRGAATDHNSRFGTCALSSSMLLQKRGMAGPGSST